MDPFKLADFSIAILRWLLRPGLLRLQFQTFVATRLAWKRHPVAIFFCLLRRVLLGASPGVVVVVMVAVVVAID